MKYKTLCKLERVTDKLEVHLLVIGAIPVFILYSPFYLYSKLQEKYEERKQKKFLNNWTGNVEDIKKLSYGTKDELVEMGKINIAELPHDHKNYHRDSALFPFHRKKKLNLDFQEIAYVENKHCERMHRFFEEQAEWIKDFEHWHGFRIVFINGDDIKEALLFPQDFDGYMNHGFLWDEHTSSGDPEYGFDCQYHIYVDIELTSDEDIKKQMHLFMSKVYESFQWMLV